MSLALGMPSKASTSDGPDTCPRARVASRAIAMKQSRWNRATGASQEDRGCQGGARSCVKSRSWAAETLRPALTDLPRKAGRWHGLGEPAAHLCVPDTAMKMRAVRCRCSRPSRSRDDDPGPSRPLLAKYAAAARYAHGNAVPMQGTVAWLMIWARSANRSPGGRRERAASENPQFSL